MLTDIGAAALLIAVIVQTTKWLLDYVVPPLSPNQANLVRLYVFAISVTVVLSTDWAYDGLHSRTDVIGAIKFALSAGAVAIASYHLLTSNTIPALSDFVTAIGKPAEPLPVLETVPLPAVPVPAEVSPLQP
jgi:hypothetical protein